jgi:hypothetical protein
MWRVIRIYLYIRQCMQDDENEQIIKNSAHVF